MMNSRLSAVLLIAFGGALAMACSSALDTFRCESSQDCVSEGQLDGICEPTRLCSFSDSRCGEDGRRYGEASGELSNACVGDDDTRSDASVDLPSDASISVPDASPALVDGDVLPAPDGAAPPQCDALLTLVVYDDAVGNDFVRVKSNGAEVLECNTVPVAAGADSMGTCEYCMTVGLEIELKAESKIRLETLVTNCAGNCENDDNCTFNAAVSCTAIYRFDVDFTPPQQLP